MINIVAHRNKWLGWLTAGLCLCLCGACSEEEWVESTNESLREIVLDAGYPTASRASDKGFADQDAMGVFVVDYEADKPGTLLPQGNRANNAKYVLNEKEDRWESDVRLYWKDEHTPIDVYGYYPYQSEVDDVEQLPFTVAVNQSVLPSDTEMGSYEASDFLWAAAKEVHPTSSVISLNYKHLLAGISVSLSKGDGFTAGEWEKLQRSVLMQDVLVDATIDLADGSVMAKEGRRLAVVPLLASNEYRAVVVPQTIAKGSTLFSITVDKVSYSFAKEVDLTLMSGKMHRFTIQVNRNSANEGDYSFKLIQEEITNWIDDPELHDGIIREYITVKVKEPGTLAECLAEQGKEVSAIRGLKIIGKLNENDFHFMRESLSSLKNLNLKEVILTDLNGRPNAILPAKAFEKHPKLSHVVFPDQLEEIGESCFEDTKLMGTLVLPTGLKKIGGAAFAMCTSLKGDLILPNTVEEIATWAFHYCGFQGRLSLPRNLKKMGPLAFAHVAFTGRLILPEGLETIEEAVFNGNRFSGDLIIPKGIKVIEREAFDVLPNGDDRVKGFQGNLELPEGLKRIEDYAFAAGHFKGELVLPESLTSIGEGAFQATDFSSVSLGKNVAVIGRWAFADCTFLREEVSIPSKVERLNDFLFQNCSSLRKVILPKGIVHVGEGVFEKCIDLESVVSEAQNPPILSTTSFKDVLLDNVSLKVPASAVVSYQRTQGWREFRGISANSFFVCRPSGVASLGSKHMHQVILDAENDWEVVHKPDWCDLSQQAGSSKTLLQLTVHELAKGSGNRSDSIVFRNNVTNEKTRCEVSQYDYEYNEDQCIQLQKATKGKGVNILILGDGFDAASIANHTYMNDVKKKIQYLLDVEPYRSYKEYFNIYACIALSEEAGVQTRTIVRDIKFDTSFGGCQESLLVNEDRVMAYALMHTPIHEEKMPQTMLMVIPNTSEYHGNTLLDFRTGRAIALCPLNSNPITDQACVLREAGGRAFAKLEDESYLIDKMPDNIRKWKVLLGQSIGWFQNISLSDKLENVAWKDFVFDPAYSGEVDIYVGGLGFTNGAYRSEYNSCMTMDMAYYNLISRIEIVRRILTYAGEEFTMEKFLEIDKKNVNSY